jgi:hypothetical protein
MSEVPPQLAVPTVLMNPRKVTAELNELPVLVVVSEKAAKVAPTPPQARKTAVASAVRRMTVRVMQVVSAVENRN